jgi:hypothetical protein
MTDSVKLFSLLAVAHLARAQDQFDEAERRLNELLNGEAGVMRYVVGAIAIVLFICVVCGFIVWLAYLVCNCCRCFRGFVRLAARGMRSLCSCLCFWRSKESYGCMSTCTPFTGEFEDAEFPCPRALATMKNASGVDVEVSYCAKHIDPMLRRVFMRGAPFEKGGTKYPINVHFGEKVKTIDLPTVVKHEIKQAEAIKKSGGQQAGFVYRFKSKEDLALVEEPTPDKPYLYKIGMMRITAERTVAKQRVDEWHGSVFGNVEGVDYWRTKDAASAEQLVHAMLAKNRIARFNRKEKKFEVEWFFVPLDDVIETIKLVIEAVDKQQFEPLLAKIRSDNPSR